VVDGAVYIMLVMVAEVEEFLPGRVVLGFLRRMNTIEILLMDIILEMVPMILLEMV